MKLNEIFNDRQFYKTMIKIAIPIALQNLILSSLNMVDVIIIGGLGEQAIAAVGLANQYFFLLNLLLFGIASGSSIFTAQYWGNQDIPNIKRVLGICLFTGIAAALVFTFGGIVFPEQILKIFSKDLEVIRMGGQYLKIIALSYVVTSITFSYSFVLRSTRQVKIPMFVSIIALGINTFLNYVLVYGYWGFPALGVSGSAIGTVIARFIEVILMLTIVYTQKFVAAAKLSELTDLSKAFIKRFFKVTTPVIINESVWALGVSLYAIVYARMGTEVIASTNIAGTIERVTWVVFMGLGHSCAVMIGNKIGEGKKEDVFGYAKKFLILGPSLAVLLGIVVVFSSGWILSFYKVSPLVYGYSHKILYVFAFILWQRVVNFIIIIGILRSGGDTKFSLIVDLGGVWLVGVPMAFIGGWLLHLPIYWVYALISLEETFKLIIGVPRVMSKKWVNNLTV
jgi:putative MATE family efflux protein